MRYKNNGFLSHFISLQPNAVSPFDFLSAHPCKVVDVAPDGEVILEICNEESQADVWSVYLLDENKQLKCVATCDSEEAAKALLDIFTLLITNYISRPAAPAVHYYPEHHTPDTTNPAHY